MFYWLGRRTLMADGVFANISGIVRLFLSWWSEKYFAAAFMMILQEQKYLQEAKCLLTFRIWENQESKVRANPEHRPCAAVQLHQGIILPVCLGRNGKSWLYLPTPGDLDSGRRVWTRSNLSSRFHLLWKDWNQKSGGKCSAVHILPAMCWSVTRHLYLHWDVSLCEIVSHLSKT